MTLHPLRSRWQVALGLTALLCVAGHGHAQTAPKKTSQRAEPITLNFNNAEIESVARTLATLTGRNVVLDPRVKGNITLNTERPVPPQTALNQFAAQLRLQGYAVVESGGLYKVVPEAEAKLQSQGVAVAGSPPAGLQIVTQIFRLRHESANNLIPVLRPLISPNNTINVNPGTNALVITDYAENLQRLGRIIAALDVANGTDVDVIPLQNAIATELAPLVIRLLEGSGASTGAGGAGGPGSPGQGESFRTTLLPEPRSNSLILRAANPARVALVRSLVDKLDQPMRQGAQSAQDAAGNIHVVYLKNADATQLALTLRGVLSGEASAAAPPPGGAAPGGGGGGGAPPLTTVSMAPNAPRPQAAGGSAGGQIQADPSTNSLIITASEPQFRQLRAVIDKLDGRRAQVWVESLIAEVNADKAAEFGIQWQGPIGRAGNSVIGLLGTNFGSGGNNILNLSIDGLAGVTEGGLTPGAGLNVGALRRTNGVYALGFLARALEQTGSGNVLSTPNLLTLDNEEARIVIGQNVPFITGRYTNTGAGNNGVVNPFQTIERKDVGLTLRVRPQISESGSIKLAISQEVSTVQASSVNSASGLITNKRSIDSSVIVDDGAIVVLGGLLQDDYSDNEEKVPILGSLPLLGNLFKSQSRSRRKTNLMVFMRPVVVRDATASEGLALDRYDYMRGLQQATQPAPHPLLPVQGAPTLPPLVPRQPPPAVPAPVVPPSPDPAQALPPVSAVPPAAAKGDAAQPPPP